MANVASASTVTKGDPLGGCWFSAPSANFLENGAVKSTLLTAINNYVSGSGDSDWSTLTSGFTYVSDVSDAGVVISESTDKTEFKNMDGDTILVVKTSRSETAKVTPVDLTVDSLKQIYGDNNVDGTGSVIKVHHNGDAQADRIALFLLAYAYQGTTRRGVVLIPRYQINEKGDETLLSSALFGRELTLDTLPAIVDNKKDTIYEVIAPVPQATQSSQQSQQSEG